MTYTADTIELFALFSASFAALWSVVNFLDAFALLREDGYGCLLRLVSGLLILATGAPVSVALVNAARGAAAGDAATFFVLGAFSVGALVLYGLGSAFALWRFFLTWRDAHQAPHLRRQGRTATA